jgi:hypothetical protein
MPWRGAARVTLGGATAPGKLVAGMPAEERRPQARWTPPPVVVCNGCQAVHGTWLGLGVQP